MANAKKFDSTFIRLGVSSQQQWERNLIAAAADGFQFAPTKPYVRWTGVTGSWTPTSEGLSAHLRGVAAAVRGALPSLNFPAITLAPGVLRRVMYGGLAAVATTTAFAASMVVKGFVDYPGESLLERIEARKHSPIFGADGTLIGSLDTSGSLPAGEAAELAYIPLQGELPTTFVSAVLALENKHLNEGGIRNVCGLDLPSLFRPITTFGRAGGSGLTQQLAKILVPEWGNEASSFAKGKRWLTQLGAACSLYRAVAGDGDKSKIIATYTNLAPMWQGNGVLRGLEAAARVVFDVEPAALSNGRQLLFAASVKEPLHVVPAGSKNIACAQLYPRANNPLFEPATAALHKARANQCRVLHRAISVAPMVLTGDALRDAVEELRTFQRDGIEVANPFEPISEKKLVNLATRTAAAMPVGLLNKIRDEAESASHVAGEPLMVSLDAVKQHAFSESFKSSLLSIQKSTLGKTLLCLPLVAAETMPTLRSCGAPKEKLTTADILAVKVDVRTGGLKTMYASSPAIMNSQLSIGSVAKWVILTAAIADGYRPDTLVCPLAAFDGKRRLKRVTQPEFGFASCVGGKHTMTLERATATSDNLAFYSLAQSLGAEKLNAVAAALGFEEAANSAPYSMAFGTFGATPRELLAASQALFGLAYDVRITGAAPRVLTNVTLQRNSAVQALHKLLPTIAQRDALRKLLEAPVGSEMGTLHFMQNMIAAGKTGTTQSIVKDATGRNYANAKWAVSFQPESGEMNLFLVASPIPSLALAHHSLPASIFASSHQTLLSSNQEK